jgi:ATP-dependent DNA helicase PIF1
MNSDEITNKWDKFRDMLGEIGVETDTALSDEQSTVLKQVQKGRNVLVMGPGGCGKSFLIKELRYKLQKEGKNVALTSTTGLSAFTIGGTTINSYMGVGTGQGDTDSLVKRVLRRYGMKQRIQNTDVLVVDEVSMLSAEFFEKLNVVCQRVRRNYRFFGGIQVLFFCDFYQLNPVFNDRNNENQDKRLVYESELFLKEFKSNTFVLEKNYRQTDQKFLNMLLRVREGIHNEDDIQMLKGRIIGKNDLDVPENAIHLVGSNLKAQAINKGRLAAIDNSSHIYTAEYEHVATGTPKEDLKNELMLQFKQKGVETVELKIDARVMLIKNLDIESGLVNGSCGTVIDFVTANGLKCPKIKFDNGVVKTIEPAEFEVEALGHKSVATQMPLMLCWALTFHKCQSITLDCAVMSLSDCFCEHQVYVALSRVKTLDGVFLETFDPKKIIVNQKVSGYLKTVSNALK